MQDLYSSSAPKESGYAPCRHLHNIAQLPLSHSTTITVVSYQYRAPEMESKTPEYQSVIGTLVFLKRLDLYEKEKPYCIHVPASAVPGGKHTNEEDELVETAIHDLRHQKEAFNIDRNGFEVINCPPIMGYPGFSSKELVETMFLPKIESAIKDKLGASHAWVYDWKVWISVRNILKGCY